MVGNSINHIFSTIACSFEWAIFFEINSTLDHLQFFGLLGSNKPPNMRKFFFLLVVYLISTIHVNAQNEVLRELNSLSGITSFGVVVNIEKPASIEAPALDVSQIRNEVIQNLDTLSVEIIEDVILRQSDQFPILHIHVNVMKASNLTYPYSIELNFYQPVKLVLKGDLRSMASTWNMGQVGLVSENMLYLIAEEAVHAANQFKQEFAEVN